MSDDTPVPPDEIKKQFAAQWPGAMKVFKEVAAEMGLKIPNRLYPDHLDGDDKTNLHIVITNAIERYPEYTDILNALNKEIQS